MAKMSAATIKLLEKLHQHNAIYYMQLAIRECLVMNIPVCWLNDYLGFSYVKTEESVCCDRIANSARS